MTRANLFIDMHSGGYEAPIYPRWAIRCCNEPPHQHTKNHCKSLASKGKRRWAIRCYNDTPHQTKKECENVASKKTTMGDSLLQRTATRNLN